MTCSDRELWQRAEQARRLGAHAGGLSASYGIGQGFVDLITLTVHSGGGMYGPFGTVDEAMNMIAIDGGSHHQLRLARWRPEMKCSQDELLCRQRRAAELGMDMLRVGCASELVWVPNGRGYVSLHTLTVYIDWTRYGPFSTVDEALNMLILLGGGPK